MSGRALLKLMLPPGVVAGIRKLQRSFAARDARRRLEGSTRLHLGCGDHVLPGWANIDLNGNRDVVGWDLTLPLPVRSDSVELVYTEHFIEHITRPQAKGLLAECHRVLRRGGVLRLSTPDLERLVQEYLGQRTAEWHDMGWQPATACQMVNEGMRLWGHHFLYDARELTQLLEEVGFRDVRRMAWHSSGDPRLVNLECRPWHGDLILEAVK